MRGLMARRHKHRWTRLLPILLAIAASVALSACNPEQSALHPAGTDAGELSRLFWIMTISGAVIWCIVMGITVYAVLGKKRPKNEQFADRFILIGGVAFPTITLAALLVVGLALLPSWVEAETPNLRVAVQGEQYWWRLSYEAEDGTTVETANELHLPVGQTAEFTLTSTDVIHSFWIPSLGGKTDLIPGRTNTMRLTPTEAGVYRGVCAEFCGPSHALMGFPVVVHEAEDYARWLAHEREPATSTLGASFISAGCGACHTVRGISEAGSVGPDLTHFAGRRTLGAGTLPITEQTLHDWLVAPSHIKPDNRMPSFATLPDAERDAIVAFLLDLR
jgi:cytochrome c oxidase subunit II